MTKYMASAEAIKPKCTQILTQTAWWVNRMLENQGMEPDSLNANEINLLIAMRIERKMTLTHVCEHTGISSQERTGLLLSLFKKGLIHSHPFRGEQGICLTSQGEAALKNILPIISQAESLALKGFSEKEKQQLLDFVARIKNNCRKTV